jgi:hypothetical protein
VLAGRDGDESGDAGVDLARIEQRYAPGDHAVLFELLDAAPARRCRETDAAAYLGNGNSRVLLQNLEDFSIKPVHHGAPLEIYSDFTSLRPFLAVVKRSQEKDGGRPG